MALTGLVGVVGLEGVGVVELAGGVGSDEPAVGDDVVGVLPELQDGGAGQTHFPSFIKPGIVLVAEAVAEAFIAVAEPRDASDPEG